MPYIAEKDERDEPLYPDYLPNYDKGDQLPIFDPFDHEDVGHRADPAFPNLLKNAQHRPVTPKFGTEIEGIQLTDLTSEGLDELGLLVAQRGFAVFRNQDFKDAGQQKQLDIAGHYGPLHQHFRAPHVGDHKEFTVMYQSAADVHRMNFWGERNSLINWHTDQAHEPQPPGVTFFWVLENQASIWLPLPSVADSQDWVGGDTIMLDCVQAFERLSDPIKSLLLGLHAYTTDNLRSVHPKVKGNNTLHPVVTQHPVTRDKILFVNECFTSHIKELTREESQYLLQFLYDYQARAGDLSARVKWEEGSVVVWDQRRVLHTATLDTEEGKRRHLIRLMARANVPIPAGQ